VTCTRSEHTLVGWAAVPAVAEDRRFPVISRLIRRVVDRGPETSDYRILRSDMAA